MICSHTYRWYSSRDGEHHQLGSQDPQNPNLVVIGSLLNDMSFQIMFPGLKLNPDVVFQLGIIKYQSQCTVDVQVA